MKPIYLISFTLITVVSCTRQKEASTAPETPIQETVSFLGKPLFAKVQDPIALAKADSTIDVIQSKNDLTEEDYIDISRSLVGTGRFRAAVENFSKGLQQYPTSYKLLRHRGHRYLNLRELDNAIADLSKAEELIRTEPEVWEYDGAGNPTATYQHQIWYHIGLYHFLNREYKASADAYERSLAYTKEGNNIAGASAWLYEAYQRSGQASKIPALLKPFTLDFDIEDKNYSYYQRLLFYNGEITEAELVDANLPIDQLSLGDLTELYGLANWYATKGDSAKANDFCKKIVQSNDWAGFAIACAELDLKERQAAN